MSITFLIVNILLWVLVAVLALTAAVRSKALFREGATEGTRDFVLLLPRIMIGVVGSGYIAAIMPQNLITTWIGPKSGILGIVIATLAGAITPGGAVVRLLGRRGCAQGRRRRPASHRLYDRLVALCVDPADQLGGRHDAAQRRLAAGGGLNPLAVPGRCRRHADRAPVTGDGNQ